MTTDEADEGNVEHPLIASADVPMVDTPLISMLVATADALEVGKTAATRQQSDIAGAYIRNVASLWDGLFVAIAPEDAIVPHNFFTINQSESSDEQQKNDMAIEFMDKVVVGSTAVVSTSLSVGYVIWILRGGSLLTAFVSALPAWQSFDPLPILESFDKDDPEDGESLLTLVTRKAARGKK